MFRRYFIYTVVTFFTVLFSCSSHYDTLKVPMRHQIHISIDGIFDTKEWEHSRVIDITQKNKMYLVHNEDYFFLGIKNNESVARYIDLYIENDSIGTINLHASMQLSERVLSNVWNDTIPKWNWGNNNNWIANKVKPISNDESIPFIETVTHYEGFEFKISKNKLKSNTSKIRIEIKDFIGKETDIIFPSESERLDTERWFLLKLE